MRYSTSINTTLKILTALALEKEFEQYRMPKLLKKTYRTVLRHTQELEKRGLIRVSRRELSRKGGISKKFYTLTFYGLLTYFCLVKNPLENLEIVAKNYPDMLLTFKKWHLFQKPSVKKQILSYFKDVIENSLYNYMTLIRVSYHLSFKERLKVTKEEIDEQIIFRGAVRSQNPEIAKICKQDKELKEFIEEQFKIQHEQIAFEQKIVNEAETWWNKV